MKIQKERKGSYTVEASLLMGIILPVLVSIIYMGFFLHDRGFTQAAAHEAASCASLRADEKGADIAGAVTRLTKGRLLGTPGISGQYTADEKEVRISYEGTFRVPGMILPFLGEQKISSVAVISVERPSRRIQKIRGIAKIAETARRRGN